MTIFFVKDEKGRNRTKKDEKERKRTKRTKKDQVGGKRTKKDDKGRMVFFNVKPSRESQLSFLKM